MDRVVVDSIHLDQIREHGGLAGLRDENALEAALARPRHKWHYRRKPDIPALAAAYGFGLSRGHPYRDGNKRVALLVMLVFLDLNGWGFDADETSVVQAMIALADGTLTERALAAWIRRHFLKPARGR